jgi:hypothetical protein
MMRVIPALPTTVLFYWPFLVTDDPPSLKWERFKATAGSAQAISVGGLATDVWRPRLR